MFYISLLEPAKGSTPAVINDDIQSENDDSKYKVEAILGIRKIGS